VVVERREKKKSIRVGKRRMQCGEGCLCVNVFKNMCVYVSECINL
jgi:hypothetical protein